MTVASRDESYALSLAQGLSGPNFRAYTSADMVGVVSFLLSDDSRWVTGQTLSVNGGLLHR